MGSSVESEVERFVHALLVIGGWLDEVALGLCAELPKGSYPGEEPWAVVLEMLCGTIGMSLQSAEPGDLRRATELIELAASAVEEHLRLARERSGQMHDCGDDDPRTYG